MEYQFKNHINIVADYKQKLHNLLYDINRNVMLLRDVHDVSMEYQFNNHINIFADYIQKLHNLLYDVKRNVLLQRDVMFL